MTGVCVCVCVCVCVYVLAPLDTGTTQLGVHVYYIDLNPSPASLLDYIIINTAHIKPTYPPQYFTLIIAHLPFHSL